MMNFVPNAVDVFSEWTAKVTTQFIKTYIGKIFLAIVLVGPITFLPTMYQAWTAPDIDALRTSTWPLMILVNISAFVGVAHQGDWRLRLTMIIWTVVMIIIWLATLIR
ncbi:MAG: hypothetical protein CMM82_00300 [Rhodospirillales bacterium]|nr:hypothetical protein [Rhodospirillales bacterium]MBC93026.1 hypothetical protein [Rhodospirillaceae bacterium]|tara:strand:+ start:2001 stop:2324 length:324 start_codon:yes stop_codon:yes gene_type:complete